MRVNREQLYTESLGCNIASDSASLESSQSQIHANHVVFKPHYPKYLVNLYFRIIDLPFGIANLPFRIDSGKFVYTTGILGSDPHQWKYETPTVEIRVDPTSGNMVLIR